MLQREPEFGKVATPLGVICNSQAHFSETSVSQFLHPYRKAFAAHFQCVHTAQSVHCTHSSFDPYISEHKTKSLLLLQMKKSSNLKIFPLFFPFSSPLSTVLCTVFFLASCFLMSFFTYVIFPPFSFIFLFFSSSSSLIAYFWAVPVTTEDFTSFRFVMIHFGAGLSVT
jgi:hypothetical protein